MSSDHFDFLYENEAFFFCFFFLFFVFDHGEKTQKPSCKHITLTTWPTSLSLLCLFFLSPPVLYSLEERAAAPSVTPYCGPLTCQGAMWSILMSINHYHNTSDKSVVHRRQMCVKLFVGRRSLVGLRLLPQFKLPFFQSKLD